MRLNPRKVRETYGMSQEKFWAAIGVTQSGGSRYEHGRPLSKPVKILFCMYYMQRGEHHKYVELTVRAFIKATVAALNKKRR